MPLEQQTTSLEVSQNMEKLGFKQESLFYVDEQDGDITYGMFTPPNYSGHTFISAFTCSELGEMLPAYFGSHYNKQWGKWTCFDGARSEEFTTLWVEKAETEADARGKMLIYLAENGLIDPKNI